MVYLFNQGMALVFQEKHEEAIQYFDLALRRDPINHGIYSFRALALKALGQFDAALVSINRAIMCCKQQSGLPSLYHQKGQILMDAGRTEEGLSQVNQAFKQMTKMNDIDDDIITMTIGHALYLSENGKWQEALSLFDIVLKLGTWNDSIDWTVDDVIGFRHEAKQHLACS